MVQQGKDLKDMDLNELKARAYDLISVGENIQRQLQETNQLIRAKAVEPNVVKETDDK